MAYKPIDQYGIIGDMHSAALVGTDGSIDWCCFPRFDSPSVFAAILDEKKGGRFQIAPTTPGSEINQTYLPNTNILSTRFTTPTGELTLTDFMPVRDFDSSRADPHEVHRVARCTSGEVQVSCTFQPRLDYARATTTLASTKGGVIARGNHQGLSLCSQVPLEIRGANASAQFNLRQGEEAVFVLAYGNRRPHRVESYHTHQEFEHTKAYWEAMAARIAYDGMWRDQVVRSFLVLHLMMYERTGAIVAAPTTSLPESIAGSRTWDYRYSWLRDSSFTMGILYRMGHIEKASRYLKWLMDQCKVTNGKTRIVYGITPSSSLNEITLDHLEGYKGSQPVRIGNSAARHLQLDVFGEVILGIDSLYRNGGGVSDAVWSLVEHFANVVSSNWRRKDRGLWEVRGPTQHFVYSKIMCWAALHRAARLAKELGRDSKAGRWRSVAEAIKTEILQRGWSQSKQAFVQRYDSDTLDASNLIIPFIGFLPPDDPRVSSTINAISRELAEGPFVRRYIPRQTADGLDGEEEGAFTLLSFWMIGNLIYTGQIEKAETYFEQIMGTTNHLGLLAEMIDPRTKQFLGNFPQAYSHIGLIHTARNLSLALSGKPVQYSADMVNVA